MKNATTLTIVIRSKDKVLYDGQAYAITGINDKGPFDILDQHENFITLIKDKIIIHTTPKEMQEIKIDNGVLRVYRDKVYIYLNFKS